MKFLLITYFIIKSKIQKFKKYQMELQRPRKCFFCKISAETPYLIHSYLCKSYNYYELYDNQLLFKNRQFILQLFKKYKGGYSEFKLQLNDKDNSILKKYFKFDDTYQVATNTIRKCSIKHNKIIMHFNSQFFALLRKNQSQKDKIRQIEKGRMRIYEQQERQRCNKKLIHILSGVITNKSNSSEQLRALCSKIGENNAKTRVQKNKIKFLLFQEFQKLVKKKNKNQIKKQIIFKKSLQNKHSQIINKQNLIYKKYNPEVQCQNLYGLVPKKQKNRKSSLRKNYQKKRMSTQPTNANTLSLKSQKMNIQITKATNMRSSGKSRSIKQKLHRSKSADKKFNFSNTQKNGVFKITESRFRQCAFKK